jgi:hypothetical protein
VALWECVMSAPFVASAVLFAGIGLVALALGLYARRHFRQAFTVGLCGLLALSGTSTWMTLAASSVVIVPAPSPLPPNPPAIPPPPAADSSADDLQQKLKNALEDQQTVVRERDVSLSAAAKLREVLDAERKASKEMTARQNEAEAKVLIRDDEVARLRGELSALRSKSDLHSLLSATSYVLIPRDEPEIVMGWRGRWYTVQLGTKIEFADREFNFPAAERLLRGRAEQFKRDVLAPLAAQQKGVRLFVRGSADERSLAKPADRPSLTDYMVLPRLTDGAYSPQPDARRVTVVDNRDLPNLRAIWLRQTLSQVLGDIAILDNRPAGQSRSAELILFVPQ